MYKIDDLSQQYQKLNIASEYAAMRKSTSPAAIAGAAMQNVRSSNPLVIAQQALAASNTGAVRIGKSAEAKANAMPKENGKEKEHNPFKDVYGVKTYLQQNPFTRQAKNYNPFSRDKKKDFRYKYHAPYGNDKYKQDPKTQRDYRHDDIIGKLYAATNDVRRKDGKFDPKQSHKPELRNETGRKNISYGNIATVIYSLRTPPSYLSEDKSYSGQDEYGQSIYTVKNGVIKIDFHNPAMQKSSETYSAELETELKGNLDAARPAIPNYTINDGVIKIDFSKGAAMKITEQTLELTVRKLSFTIPKNLAA
jgi:hypothetical protein